MKKMLLKIIFGLFVSSFLLGISSKTTEAGILVGPERCTPQGFWGWFGNADTGIDTALGCIPLEIGWQGSEKGSETFTRFILRWAIGLGGGVAFLLIVYSSFLTITSAGNPQRVQAGKELLTSAITGLLMLIGSVYILKLIGVDILGLQEIGL